jgi:hypothetical protein
MGSRGLAIVLLLSLAVAGCGRKEEPKVDAATEQKEALERSKEGAFGTQVKALEAAKTMGADLDRKARESVEKAEQDAK